MDIGYSSVKLSLYKDGEVQTLIYPNGAAVRSLLASNADLGNAYILEHKGEQWVAGIESDRIQQHTSRNLDGGFIKTDEYEVLVKSALLACGVNEIDLLVTGLPVNQTKGDGKDVDFLADMVVKNHEIKKGYSVNVKNAYVIPQPVGAFVDALSNHEPDSIEAMLFNETVLVVDPGFYSVDWVIFSKNELHDSSSDTSNDAMSSVFSDVANSIGEDYTQVPSLDKVESAVRNGSYLISGSSVIKNSELMEYVKKAGLKSTKNPTKELRACLVKGKYNVSIIVCAGGGASVYAEAIKNDEFFKDIRVEVSDEPVLANARGYMQYGLMQFEA